MTVAQALTARRALLGCRKAPWWGRKYKAKEKTHVEPATSTQGPRTPPQTLHRRPGEIPARPDRHDGQRQPPAARRGGVRRPAPPRVRRLGRPSAGRRRAEQNRPEGGPPFVFRLRYGRETLLDHHRMGPL